MKLLLTLIISLTGFAFTAWAAELPFLHAPSVDTYAKHDPNGLTILSSGRYLKPVGRHLPVAHDPYGLAMSRDGQTLFAVSDGVGQIITDWRAEKPVVTVVNPPMAPRKGKKERAPNGGGAGQFAEVWMCIEPKPRDTGAEFTQSLTGQNVDRSFVPSVEKGVKRACEEGILASYRVVDVKINP